MPKLNHRNSTNGKDNDLTPKPLEIFFDSNYLKEPQYSKFQQTIGLDSWELDYLKLQK